MAEDRIPSYAIITHGAPGSYTTWVDGAVFDFQAETNIGFTLKIFFYKKNLTIFDIESFVKQRRRWINGALFSYVWLTLGIIRRTFYLNLLTKNFSKNRLVAQIKT